jgi:hypothetical protein
MCRADAKEVSPYLMPATLAPHRATFVTYFGPFSVAISSTMVPTITIPIILSGGLFSLWRLRCRLDRGYAGSWVGTSENYPSKTLGE